MEQLREIIMKQLQFFRIVNCQNVDVKHKSHLCLNKNMLRYGIAVVMLLLMKQVSVFWLHWANYG